MKAYDSGEGVKVMFMVWVWFTYIMNSFTKWGTLLEWVILVRKYDEVWKALKLDKRE